METIHRLIGSPFRALTVFSLLAFLIANAEMTVAGLRADDSDRGWNGGFGVVLFVVVLAVMSRHFLRSDPDTRAEWVRARRFVAGPIRLIVLASLGFLVVVSAGTFVSGVVSRDPTNTINGSIGATLLAFVLFQTAKALATVDAELAAERGRYPESSPPRRPLYMYPVLVGNVLNATPGRRYIRTVLGFFLVLSAIGTVILFVERDPRLIIFPPVFVLFALLLVAAVGALSLADERRSDEE